MNTLMLYLLQVAICHTVFYLLYRALYSNHPYFNFNRIYLLSARYAYFRIDTEEVVAENKVLNMKIQEGDVAYINDIIIKGNSSITTAEILKMIEFEKGDKFSRSKIMQTQENLKKSKLFKAYKVDLNIQPLEDLSKINIEFIVEK